MAVKENQLKPGKIIVVVLLIAGAGLLYWLLFLKPAISEIGVLRNEKAELSREIDRLTTKLAHKPEIEQKWDNLRENEKYLLARISEAADLPQVLGAMEQLMGSFPVEIEGLTAAGFQQDEQCCFIPVSLKVKGAAEELLLLLKKLEQFTHMTLTEQASIEESEGLHRMIVNFNLIFIPEGQVETVGPEEDQG